MSLRYNKVLKLFAILIFSIELIVPTLVAAFEQDHVPTAKSGAQLTNVITSVDFLTTLLCEEASNEEEREGKDDYVICVAYTEVFSHLQKFEPSRITWTQPKEKFDIQPSLYRLHRVLLI
jgi:hypothetical protein